jgi:hypothetical protein
MRSSTTSFCCGAKNAGDLHEATCFLSLSAPNQWLRYDFKGRRVSLT